MRALILVADNVEDIELFYSYYRLRPEILNTTTRSPSRRTWNTTE
jgi:putative intracellular protease/amidase